MKNLTFTLICVLFFNFSWAQTPPEIGDELLIGEAYGENYKYIDVPRLNILMKRGIVDGYKSFHDNTVVVEEVITSKDNTTYVILKRKDNSKFFGFLNTVKAKYDKAKENKELIPVEE